MNNFSDIVTLSTFPIFMEGSPSDAKEEDDVTALTEEKLDFDDETLKGKEYGQLKLFGNAHVGFI